MTTADEGVREIQLSGKQLVFLFMAVTVVSVVIFLCGVLVGRGVQSRTAYLDTEVIGESPVDAGAGAATTEPPAIDQPTPRADVTFPKRLENNEPPPEKLVARQDPPANAATAPPATAPPVRAATPAEKTASAPTAAAPPAAAARPAAGIPTEPKGGGYAIQVAAFNARDEAETLAKRLLAKGYSVFLVTPQAGQPAMFRVRVGKFQQRAEAERVAARLEREEQFKPWITR
ncbi:MAG: SPOR domain-containing protein [Vicinamibacterales bacterium]